MTSEMLQSSDGTAIYLVHSPVEGEAKAHILICHGANEHIGRYTHVIKALNDAGYSVSGMDLRGHGKSGGKRCHVLRWERYSEDIRVAAQSIGGSLFILGHSMGGLVVLEALRSGINGVNVQGALVSNPLIGLAFDPPKVKTFFAKLLSTVVPGLLMGNELNADHLSHDKDMNAAYLADPLVSRKLSPRWFTEMNSAVSRVKEAAPNYKVPFLLMQGTADPITSAEAAGAFYETYGGPKTLQAHEGLYHEIFNEIERDKVLADMIGWLDSQVLPA
jgi:lysophospholipase